VISIIMISANVGHNQLSSSILHNLGAPTIILALISVGMQLKPKIDIILWKEISAGLIYKLLLAPAVIFAIAVYIFNIHGLIFKVSLIESAMPPMVMGSVLATQFELNPKLANLMIGIGIPLSAATLALWYLLIR
ncbi:MAG: AEC family transporter, partial [Ignavibacteria bacterium]